MNRGRGGFRGGRGGGRGGFSAPQGPPDTVLEMGEFIHPCEGDIVCRSINPKIPYFNAPIFLENKSQVGKVDEILGPMNEVYFTIKPAEGIQATSFKSGDKFFIAPDRLLPLERFLPKPKVAMPKVRKPKSRGTGAPGGGRGGFSRGGGGFSRGGGRGGSFGGRGGGRGGAGFSRGGGRGGFGAPRGGRGGFGGGRGGRF